MITGKAAALQALYQSYAMTEILRQVSDGRRLVPGCGPLDAPLVIAGEAPGEQEEAQGRPFIGPAGQELQRLLHLANVPWEMCYVMNTLPWRPPGNRTPYPFEISASMRRVHDEIRIIGPLVVVAAGAVAWQAITGRQHGPFGDHRGRWMRWSPEGHNSFSCDLLAVYHPSALLRAPGNRRPGMEAETLAALQSILEGDRAI